MTAAPPTREWLFAEEARVALTFAADAIDAGEPVKKIAALTARAVRRMRALTKGDYAMPASWMREDLGLAVRKANALLAAGDLPGALRLASRANYRAQQIIRAECKEAS